MTYLYDNISGVSGETQAYRYDAAGAVASMDLPQGRETSVPRLSY